MKTFLYLHLTLSHPVIYEVDLSQGKGHHIGGIK